MYNSKRISILYLIVIDFKINKLGKSEIFDVVGGVMLFTCSATWWQSNPLSHPLYLQTRM